MKLPTCDARSAVEIARDVNGRTCEPLADVEAALLSINRQDADVRAWAYVRYDSGSLNPLSSGAAPQPLAGVPVGVKDIIDVAGMPTACGSAACDVTPVQFDASSVAILRQAGAVPVGKTVTAEFAYVTPGSTRNPHDLTCTPGGSSSGSAAAVAAGMVPISLGTQTGGSMIRPASYCGVVGFKPTFGLVARDGMKVTCESLDVIGWFARDVFDIALVSEVLLPGEYQRGAANLQGTRITCLDSNPGHVLEPAGQAVIDDARRALELHGCRVRQGTIDNPERLLNAHSAIMHYEFSRSLLPVFSLQARRLSEPLIAAVKQGLAMSAADYLQARGWQDVQRRQWESYFPDADVVMTTSALGPAPEGLASTGPSAFNKAWSLLGWPCIHLPTAYSDRGLPLGVQLVGPPGSDRRLIESALMIHQVVDERRENSGYLA